MQYCNVTFLQETDQMFQARLMKKQDEEEEEGVDAEGFQEFITNARYKWILWPLQSIISPI